MSPDDAADLLADLPEDRRQHFINMMEKDDAEDMRELLSYPEQWGLFRLFGQARWESRSRNEFRVVWNIAREGTTYAVEGTITPAGEPLLQPLYFSRLTCRP
jgi:type VI protein secretion system component VasK